MPLSLDQLGGLITSAPPQMYQGGAGSGMRQLGEQRSKERMQMAELNLHQQRMESEQKLRQRAAEDEMFKTWGAAVMTGDPEAIELSAQQLERAGFKVKRPAGAEMPSEDAGASGAAPPNLSDFTGAGGKPPENLRDFTGQDIGDQSSIDAFFRTKVGKPGGKAQAPAAKQPAAQPQPEQTAAVAPHSPEEQAAFESELLSDRAIDPFSPKTQKRVPDWVVTRSDGSVVAAFDDNQIREQRRGRVAETFAPLIEGAPDEVSRQSAINAARVAMKVSDSEGVNAAVDRGMKVYEFGVGPRRGRWVGGGGGGGSGGPSLSQQRFELSKDSQVARYAQGLINNEQQNGSARKWNEVYDNSLKSLEMASSKNPIAQLGAKTGMLKAFFSSVTSDKELAAFEGAGGKVNQLETELNKYIASGQLPEDFLRRLQDVSRLTAKKTQELMRERGLHARKRIELDPYLNEQLDPKTLKSWGDQAESVWLQGGEQVKSGGAAPKPNAPTDDDVADLLE